MKSATQKKASGGVLAFGEVLWDKLPNGSVLGGAPANFGSRVQSLGVPVTLVSRVGEDTLGEQTLQELQRMGLGTSHIQRDKSHATGTVEVHFDKQGLPGYHILPDVAYDHVAWTDELEQAAKACRMLYFGTLAQRGEQSRQALSRLLDAAPNAIKLLDVNLREKCFTKATVEASLERANILKLNEVEVEDLGALLQLGGGDIASFCDRIIARYDLDLCLVTRGPLGAIAKTRDAQALNVPGYEIKVVDTIGAGDAFTAGFVWAHLGGESLADSCEMGVRCGALVATHRGGSVPISAEQLKNISFTKRNEEP